MCAEFRCIYLTYAKLMETQTSGNQFCSCLYCILLHIVLPKWFYITTCIFVVMSLWYYMSEVYNFITALSK